MERALIKIEGASIAWYVSLASDKSNTQNEDSVNIMTIHSAKGLEFDKVIVCDIYSKGEENMRLNYVAVTRARDELYLCI